MNNFSGYDYPEFLGSFKRLEYLNLSYCGFEGVVPHHLGNLSRLKYLDLAVILEDRVFFSFSLPVIDDIRWVSSLSSLKYLSLSGIRIGKHNTLWFHSVNMLPSLLKLNLASCYIDIPSVKVVNSTSLKSLDLSSNYINSTIPVWLSNLTDLLHLDFHRNNFHGQIPDSLETLSSLTSIDLSFNSFDTTMPKLFWNLSHLVHLDLSSNIFHGSVLPHVKLCNLSILNFSENKFAGDFPSFIGNMSDCMLNSLRSLNINGNHFDGSIPTNLGDFKKLESLLLSLNTLSGHIPSSLGGLSSLINLDISGNKLNGRIPSSFGQLSRLKTLHLSYNQLSGNIPKSLGQLSMLEILHVSDNSLVGILSETHFTKLKSLTLLSLSTNSLALNVSSRWIPPFQLEEFDASSCNIGPHFPNWLETQTNLEMLYLRNSSIRDTLPEWFENIRYIYDLDLSHNQISGKVPSFNSLSYLPWPFERYLKLNSNKFEGSFTSFPSHVRTLDLSDNLLTGHVPQTNETMNPELTLVNLSKNRLTGSVPVYFCNMGPSIRVLDLSQNEFSGSLPGCLGNLNRLLALDLTNNSITGVVPSSFGSLIQLESLHLHNNRLEGVIPVSLQNLSALITMDLGNNLFTGSIPFWIGEKLPNIRILNLQSNKFMGNIPLQICDLKVLQYLNLAQNNISGVIPHCFGYLSGMATDIIDHRYWVYEYEENILAYMKGSQLLYTKTIHYLTSLDLSSNKLVGEVPDVLMNLVGLKNLNLSGNLLGGQIPTKIGNLKHLESLDLSINMLSGRIPPSLSSLNFLSYLNLSYNNLSGAIPVGNQLQTLDNPSIYEGNNGLCGPPVSRSCQRNDLSYNHHGEDDIEGFWLYVGMGPGFVVGFIGILGSLHFFGSWRVTYFKILQNVYDWFILSTLLNLARLRRKIF